MVGGRWPSGAIQEALEWMCVNVTGGDWVLAVVATTVAMRLCMFPMAVSLHHNVSCVCVCVCVENMRGNVLD